MIYFICLTKSIYSDTNESLRIDSVPEIVVVVGVCEDDVEGLEVQVDDSLTVDKLNTSHYLAISKSMNQ